MNNYIGKAALENAIASVLLEEQTKGLDIKTLLAKRTKSEQRHDSRFLFAAKWSLIYGSGFLVFCLAMFSLMAFIPYWPRTHAGLFIGLALPLGFVAACSGFAALVFLIELPSGLDWDRMLALKFLAKSPEGGTR